MKNLLCCLSLFLTINLFSQTYHPLLTEDKEWDVFYWESGAFVNPVGAERQFIQGDTLIEGLTYKVIWAQAFYPLEELFFVPPFGLSQGQRIVGFIREDSLEQKIYSRFRGDAGYPNEEYLAYDFNLQVGDTLVVGYLSGGSIHLDSISTIRLSNDEERRIFYFYNQNLLGDQFFIEGVGGSAGLLAPFTYNFEYGSYLSCFWQNGDILYNFGGGCIQAVKTQDIISPQPYLFLPIRQAII